MRQDLLLLALIVGLATWAFRFVPTKLSLAGADPASLLRRFLAATGPAAIATLFTASILPMVRGADTAPLLPGVVAVLGVYAVRRSVVLATLAGAVAQGLASVWLG